jgi:hypothetical protein
MAGRIDRPINTVATVTIGDIEYDMDEITMEQKAAISDQLNLQMLNSLYANTQYRFYINKGCQTIGSLFNLPCKKETK